MSSKKRERVAQSLRYEPKIGYEHVIACIEKGGLQLGYLHKKILQEVINLGGMYHTLPNFIRVCDDLDKMRVLMGAYTEGVSIRGIAEILAVKRCAFTMLTMRCAKIYEIDAAVEAILRYEGYNDVILAIYETLKMFKERSTEVIEDMVNAAEKVRHILDIIPAMKHVRNVHIKWYKDSSNRLKKQL